MNSIGVNNSKIYVNNTAFSSLTNEEIDHLVDSMSLEEKIGQVFISFFYGATLEPLSSQTILQSKLGNIIYYAWANELNDPKKVKELSEQIQALSNEVLGIPAQIVVDQEGGIVSRLTKNFTEFPGNMALAATGDPSLAKQVGFAMGKEMRAVGIQQTFAPVVDVNNEPENPVIGTRSFGEDPDEVIKFAKEIISGFHEAGVCVTLKHFPGHGRTKVDSHHSLPRIDLKMEDLEKIELKPFFALRKEADAIMSAHVLVPQIDSENCATLSSKFLTNILRKKYEYDGVIISDSLVMKGVVNQQKSWEETLKGVTDAAIGAFNAGSDCLILGRLEWAEFEGAKSPEINQQLTIQVLSGFKQAVEEKKITVSRLNESVKRVLLLKQKVAQMSQVYALSEIKGVEHIGLANSVAEKALTLVSPVELLTRCETKLKGRKVMVVAPEDLNVNLLESLKDYQVTPMLFKNQELSFSLDKVLQNIKKDVQNADLTIFLSFNGHVWKDQQTLLYKLSQTIPDHKLVIAGLRNPQDVMNSELYNKHVVYLTYSHSVASLRAFFHALENHKMPQGKLPMKSLKSQELN